MKGVNFVVRYISLEELSKETFFAERIKCYKQTWDDSSQWLRYRDVPRFANAFSLIHSPVTVTYQLNDGTTITAGEGDLVFVEKSSQYTVSFRGGGNGPDLYTINFLLRDREGNDLRLARNIVLFPNVVTQSQLSIADELADACLFSNSRLKKHALFLRLLDSFSDPIEHLSEHFLPIRHGVALLEKEWKKNRKIAYYAKECGISERKFYFCFKNWAGKSPVEYRNDLRIAAACSYLINTSMPISQIAFNVGFDDPYYFSRVFKKIRGVAPAAYRKNGGESTQTDIE